MTKHSVLRHTFVLALLLGVAPLLSSTLAPGNTPGDSSLSAQLLSESQRAGGTLPRVFLDCHGPRSACDFDHFRQEISFVSWVSAPEAADVHVILTSTDGGGGGRLFTLDFQGASRFQGLNDELTFSTVGTDVQREVVDGLAQALRLGLVRYAVESGLGRDMGIRFSPRVPLPGDEDAEANGNGAMAEEDPWDYWTFRVRVSGNLRISETRSERRLNPSVRANRTTEDWKLNFFVWNNFRRERIELSDGREVRNDADLWRASALVVRSVSDNISTGFDSQASNSVDSNQQARVWFAPAVEWNYFPYMEATRRQFIAHYQIGPEYSRYYEVTVFDELEETLPRHKFAVQYNQREAWGDAGVGLESAQYLHDTSLYSVGATGELNYRVLRGLELSLSGELALVNDQIHIPAQEIPDEDVLLGRRSLPTGYEYRASIALTYQWGSVFTNVVNTRFPGSVR
ncbi:MAG: hypothetical protein WEA09_15685 [Gemmatimonadota bacterium]